MPTIAIQQHSIQPPTGQTAAIEASNFGRSMNRECFFQITNFFEPAGLKVKAPGQTHPPQRAMLGAQANGRKKNKKIRGFARRKKSGALEME